ncbi:MAG TPA: AIR synthase-related protein, partial [Acidimicrobiales bacterium]|nr:AIR synthase-related protein [Acidimicrobiales bacterium]
VMWQLSESIDGMAEACRGLGLPVIGGNVSFYNESSGADIDPTPTIAVLGVIDLLERRPPGAVFSAGTTVVLLGEAGEASLAGSRWAVERRGHRGGALPALDLEAHGRLLALVRSLVARSGLLGGIHDVSGGGLGVALAECAVRSGVGCVVSGIAGHRALFTEGTGRVVACSADPEAVLGAAAGAGVPASVLGEAGGDRIVVDGLLDVMVADARAAWRAALPEALGEPVGS